MKQLTYFLLVLLFACSGNKEEALKEKLVLPVETYITSKLDKGMTLDSVIVKEIDTVTPLIAAGIELNEVMAAMEKQSEIYKLQGSILLDKADRFKIYRSVVPADDPALSSMARDIKEKHAEADKTNSLIKELGSQSAKLIEDISSHSLDSTTFLHYLITTKITVTNPDMTQESKEMLFQITKGFKLLKSD